MVIAEERDLMAATSARIFPPLKEIDSMTSGTPWPRASREARKIKGVTSNPPTAGTKRT
jgi:hypothetical protein